MLCVLRISVFIWSRKGTEDEELTAQQAWKTVYDFLHTRSRLIVPESEHNCCRLICTWLRLKSFYLSLPQPRLSSKVSRWHPTHHSRQCLANSRPASNSIWSWGGIWHPSPPASTHTEVLGTQMWATNLVYAALGWNPGKLLPSKPYTPDPSMMFSNREGRPMAQSQLKLARPSDQKTMTEGKQGTRVAFFGHWSINEHTLPSLLGPGSQYISEKIS